QGPACRSCCGEIQSTDRTRALPRRDPAGREPRVAIMTAFVTSLVAIATAALLSAGIIPAIMPLLQRYALARPNARSSHRIPTPQGAGIAVIAAALAVSGTSAVVLNLSAPVVLFGATIFIALVGMADDIKSIPVLPRLLLQAAAVGVVVYFAPAELRII